MAVRRYIDFDPDLGERVFIDDSAVVTGRVTIGDDSSVWPMTSIRGDVHEIKIGDRTNIQDGSVLHVTSPESYGPEGFPLIIGDAVTVGHKALLHGCTIGNLVLIGMGTIVMDGAVIQDNVIIGGGTLVTPGKVLESGGLYIGSPAKRVRDLNQKELGFLNYSADHYVRLKDKHLGFTEILG